MRYKLYVIACIACIVFRGGRGLDGMLVGFTPTFQSVAITIKVVGSNSDHGEVYSIQHFVIKILLLT